MSLRFTFMSLSAALLLSTATIPVAAFAAATEDTVAATVNGDKIYKKDVMNALTSLKVPAADQDKVYPQVLDQIVNEKLIDETVSKAKIEDTEQYKKQLELIKAQLVKQVYIEKFLKDKITDAKVKAEYDKFKAQNAGKEEVHARHILVPTEAEAQQVIKDLDGGAKFEDLAKKRSSGPTAQNGGDVGFFVKEEMLPEFADAAFALKPGTYTKEAVKTQFGYHVIKVEEKRKRKVPEQKEVEGAIRNKLGQEALQQLVADLRSKAKIEQFDINGKAVTAAPAADAPKKD